MDNEERKRLKTLLRYWIEHNEEHSQEFREWAAKAKGFGASGAGEDMIQAAQVVDRASEILSRALGKLERREE